MARVLWEGGLRAAAALIVDEGSTIDDDDGRSE